MLRSLVVYLLFWAPGWALRQTHQGLAVSMTRPGLPLLHAIAKSAAEEDRELRKYQVRNALLEEAVKTLRTQLDASRGGKTPAPAPPAVDASALADMRRRADDAQALAAQLAAQVESERRRTERIRLGWQSELLRVSERAAAAEEQADGLRAAALEARSLAEDLAAKVQALEAGAEQSAGEWGARVRALERELAQVRAEGADLARRLSRAQQQASGGGSTSSSGGNGHGSGSSNSSNSSGAGSSSARDEDAQAAISADLRAQRRVLERQSLLIEGLVRDLQEARAAPTASLDGARAGGGGGRQWALPEWDASRVLFSPGGQGEGAARRTAAPAERAWREQQRQQQSAAAAIATEVHTREIVVAGEPFLIDEDGNLYSAGDHAFVRRHVVAVAGAGEGQGAAPGASAPSPTSSRRQKLLQASGRLGQGLGRLVGRAGVSVKGRVASAGRALRGLGRWIVGPEGDSEEAKGAEGGALARRPWLGDVVDVEMEAEEVGVEEVGVEVQWREPAGAAAAVLGGRAWEAGRKMRPGYLDRQDMQGMQDRQGEAGSN